MSLERCYNEITFVILICRSIIFKISFQSNYFVTVILFRTLKKINEIFSCEYVQTSILFIKLVHSITLTIIRSLMINKIMIP